MEERKRALLFGLLVACPCGEEMEDCPARSVRSLPLEKRWVALNAMSDEQITELLVYHKQCLTRRRQE